MDWKKIAPWSWFKEEEHFAHRASHPATMSSMPANRDPIAAMRLEMDRLFDDVLRRSRIPGMGLLASTDDAGRERKSTWPLAALRPSVDISEGHKAYSVRVELPGVEPDDVSIEVEGPSTLVIRAEKHHEREEEDEGTHWVESAYGSAQRVLSLPEDADADAIEARFKNGVLKLKIPKHPQRAAKTRKIEIQ